MRSLFQEIQASITPSERERVGLPSSILRILPIAEAMVDDDQAPIRVDRSEWRRLESPERLVRSFQFDNYDHLMTFVIDILDYHKLSGHKGDLHVVDGEVSIEVWTKGLDRVTELDVEYVRAVDEIYRDVRFKHLGLS